MQASKTIELKLVITQDDLARMLVTENGTPEAKLINLDILPTPEGDLMLRGRVRTDEAEAEQQTTTKAGV